MNKFDKLELLAPAGDMERFDAALKYGADAVYLGAKNFGMRASPGNFTFDELKEAVDKAHKQNVKVYLTCNTLPRNEEIPGVEEFIKNVRCKTKKPRGGCCEAFRLFVDRIITYGGRGP